MYTCTNSQQIGKCIVHYNIVNSTCIVRIRIWTVTLLRTFIKAIHHIYTYVHVTLFIFSLTNPYIDQLCLCIFGHSWYFQVQERAVSQDQCTKEKSKAGHVRSDHGVACTYQGQIYVHERAVLSVYLFKLHINLSELALLHDVYVVRLHVPHSFALVHSSIVVDTA